MAAVVGGRNLSVLMISDRHDTAFGSVEVSVKIFDTLVEARAALIATFNAWVEKEGVDLANYRSYRYEDAACVAGGNYYEKELTLKITSV